MLGTLLMVWAGGLGLVGTLVVWWSFRHEPPEDFSDVFVRTLCVTLCGVVWPLWLAAFVVAAALWGVCWARRPPSGAGL